MGSIQARGKQHKIRLAFTYQAVRRYENTKYFCETGKDNCKCRQCKSATALLQEIERKIDENTFVYKEYFPKSKYASSSGIADISGDIGFANYAYQWLSLKEKSIEYSSFKTYSRYTKRLSDYFKNKPLKEIKPSTVQSYIRDNDLAPKTISNIMGMLSSIFKSAVMDEIIEKNPCTYVSKPKVHSEEVDPFDRAEIDQIISWMQKHHPSMAAFFAIAFFTGMRTGELMGLQWGDFDFQRHKINVRRTITEARVKESTKTSDRRLIDIDPILDAYINSHKQFTFMKSDWLFTTYQNEPFKHIQNITKTYYEPCLKALGIKYRNIYQTRHTFACLSIDAGAELNWVKMMLGHRTLEMILKRYGNRVNRDKKERVSLFSKPTIKEEMFK